VLSNKTIIKGEITRLPDHSKKWSRRVATCFAGDYAAGASNLGFAALCEVVSGIDSLYAQRFFGVTPYSIESNEFLGNFDIICASISFELDFINFVELLTSGNVELYAESRANKLIVVGGAAVSVNPFPLSKVADVIFLGTGTSRIIKMFDDIALYGIGSQAKMSLLQKISTIEGVWVPALQPKPPRNICSSETILPSSTVISSFSAFPNTVLVQIQRSCPYNCSFCVTPQLYSPFENFEVDRILDCAKAFGPKIRRVGLVGAAAADFTNFEQLVESLLALGFDVNLSSLRADRVDDKLIDILLRRGQQKTLTFAPETGSERLKKLCHKRISVDDIVLRVAKVVPEELKLYYIVGLPTETLEDVQETIRECLAIFDAVKSIVKKVSISVNVLIPKKFARWQNEKMDDHFSLKHKLSIFTQQIRPSKQLALDVNYNKNARAQWFLSVDENLSPDIFASFQSRTQILNAILEYAN